MITINSKHKACSLALAIAASTASVSAQENFGGIEEIIVTAQKRAQSLQEVPLAVNAYSEQFLKDANIKDFKSVISYTPGLSGQSADSFVDAITIRGINNNDFGVGVEPAVGIYLDGVYQGRNGTALSTIFDVERMEVVKGPQGTLFGRNSTGGAVSTVRKRPTEEFEGYLSAGVGSRSLKETELVVNAPVSDTLLTRLALHYDSQDGYMDNVQGGEKVGGMRDAKAGRFNLTYLGIDDVEMNFIVDYEDRLGSSSIYRAIHPSIGGSRRDADIDVKGDDNSDEVNIWSFTGDIAIELSDALSLSSITAVRGHHFDYVEDFDGTPVLVDRFIQNQEGEYASQEFRLNYDNGGNVIWFAGISAYREDLEVIQRDDADFDVIFEEDFDAGVGNEFTEPRYAKADYQGFAVYGDLTWSVTDKIELILGARYTRDKRDFELHLQEPLYIAGDDTGSAAEPINFFGYYTDAALKDSDSWSAFTPRAAVNYRINDDVMLFASYSEGYKAGGFDTNGLQLTDPNFIPYEGLDIDGDGEGDGGSLAVDAIAKLKSVDPELVKNLEVGIKSTWLDNRLQFNANAFMYEYDDLQVQVPVGRAVVLENIGTLEGRGFEADMRLVPNESWDIYLAVGYTNASPEKITKEGYCETGDSCKGKQLAGTPRWQGSAIISYHWDTSVGNVTAALEYFGQSKTHGDPDGRTTNGSWNQSNLRLNYTSPDETWEAQLWVENLFDQFYYYGIRAEEGSILPEAYEGHVAPRTLGVNVTYNF